MDRKTLLSVFLLQKDELTRKIAQAASANDLEGVQSTIAGFFDTQLSPSGEYASQLTQTEFFIMQSVMFVKDLQKKLDEQFFIMPVYETAEADETQVKVTSTPMAFIYSIFGGLLGSWAGVPLAGGAIAGLVLSTLLYKHQPDFITKHWFTRWIIARPADKKEIGNSIIYPEFNTPEIMKIFEEICTGIDDMMHAVMNQIKSNMPQASKQGPSIQELGPVLRECQKHIGLLHKTSIDAGSIGIFEDVWLSIGVEFVHYSDQTSDYFMKKTGQSTSSVVEQYPAVLINGKLHMQGLVSLPENK